MTGPPDREDAERAVLLAVRLAGVAEIDALVAATGMTAEVVDEVLAGAAAEGAAVHRRGAMTGWQLTPAGRTRGERLLAAELERRGARPAVREAYEQFCELNPVLLAVCTAWQVRTVDGVDVLNDHADPAHDTAVLDLLEAVHARLDPVLARLERTLHRFSRYRLRFDRALARVRAGDTDHVATPRVDSYHTVWFQLHEDLLATLGLDRAAETAARAAPASTP